MKARRVPCRVACRAAGRCAIDRARDARSLTGAGAGAAAAAPMLLKPMGAKSPLYQPGRPLRQAWIITVATMISTNTKPTMLMYSSCAPARAAVRAGRNLTLSGMANARAAAQRAAGGPAAAAPALGGCAAARRASGAPHACWGSGPGARPCSMLAGAPVQCCGLAPQLQAHRRSCARVSTRCSMDAASQTRRLTHRVRSAQWTGPCSSVRAQQTAPSMPALPRWPGRGKARPAPQRPPGW